MRKLIFAINVTIDGCCDHQNGLPNEEVHEYFTQLTKECSALLYGRKTFELMVPFWPDIARQGTAVNKQVLAFAEAFVAVPQIVVFSKTRRTVEEKNTTLLHGDLVAEVKKLKEHPGGPILTGGVELPSLLLEAGLIDEIRLVIHPVMAGKGRRLFDNLPLPEQQNFQLINTTAFKSGHVVLRYKK